MTINEHLHGIPARPEEWTGKTARKEETGEDQALLQEAVEAEPGVFEGIKAILERERMRHTLTGMPGPSNWNSPHEREGHTGAVDG